MRHRQDLRGYQFRAIHWLIRKPASGLFLKMGLGKTVILLTAYAELKAQRPKRKALLVIGPLRPIQSVWEQEAKEWSHLKHLTFVKIVGSAKQREQALYKKADVYLMNVDNLVWLVNTLRAMQQKRHPLPFDWLALDESSAFKNPGTKRFRAMRALLPVFTRRNILTGTPRPNSMLELWPQIYILDQGASLGHTQEHYRIRYFDFDFDANRYVPKPSAEANVNALLAPMVLCLDNRGLVQMPEVVHTEVKFCLPAQARALYDQMEREMFIRLHELEEQGFVQAVNSAVLIGKCHQIANGAVFDSDRRDVWHEIHNARIDVLKETLAELDSPALIAYTYQHDRERLLKALGPVPVIGGGNKDTDQIINEWNADKHPIVLIHPRSGAHGLNMQKGSGDNLIWFSNTFSNENFDQLVARLARSGHKAPFVNVYALVAVDTVDVVMRRAIERKAAGQTQQFQLLLDYQRERRL